ncbi:MAG: hypothetical protein WC485_00280 [Opitutaceae bacterium]
MNLVCEKCGGRWLDCRPNNNSCPWCRARELEAKLASLDQRAKTGKLVGASFGLPPGSKNNLDDGYDYLVIRIARGSADEHVGSNVVVSWPE